MSKLTIRDVQLSGKKVLVRVDFNVPLDNERAVTDTSRIVAALPTIRYLLEQGAKVALVSHLGRPKGQIKEELRMGPVAASLAEITGLNVVKLDTCIGEQVWNAVEALGSGEVVLLENVRFYPGEKKNDPEFAEALAAHFDLHVMDAFGTAHRAHASVAGVSRYLTSVAGFLIEKEIDYLGRAVANPERPFVAIIGGAKVSGKLEVLRNLIDKVDFLLIGGGMAYTFLKAQGHSTGNSLLEEELLDTAKGILAAAEGKSVTLLLPVDNVIADKFDNEAEIQTVAN
ncbi:MAG: phosphoglycerate kinase, partial [bacterium]|nr:phosphoglycerate kinase [bacterium]